MKRWIRKIHLWLGLASGLVVFILSVTGCLFVFQKEITECVYKDVMFITPSNQPELPISILFAKAQEYLGESKTISRTTTYRSPDKAWEFMSFKGNNTALTYWGCVEHYDVVYINPYTGDVTGTIDYKHNFFSIVKYLHWSLLLNTKYGQPIVGWSTLIFVIMLVTGLILWYPKQWNKTARKSRFKVLWKAKFKRLNYDLHNVLGFYVALVALIIALTGMVWAFTWFKSVVYVAASGTTYPPKYEQVKSIKPDTIALQSPIDVAYYKALAELPDAPRFYLSLPRDNNESTIQIGGYKYDDRYYSRTDMQFDQHTAALLAKRDDKDKNHGERLLEMNYDIHVGAIGGITGKIIVFFAALVCATLPVTGFYIWRHKRRKATNKS